MSSRFYFTLMIGLCLRSLGIASGETNRYSIIAQRNVFALKTPARPIASAPEPVTLTKLKLTGLVVLPPHKWAVIELLPTDKSAFSITLGEGESESGVEVINIDGKANQVTLRYADVLMNLAFENNSKKSKSDTFASQLPDNHRPLPTVSLSESGDP